MRILITGGKGQLGRELQRALAAHDVSAPGRDELDVSDETAVARMFADLRPEAVVHCAALTDTTRCEREPDAAHAVNALGTRNIAAACARARRRLVAVSTNEVFDGRRREPYVEDDQTAALNAYGRSKLDGERLALEAHPETLVVRTSWVYGLGGANYVEKVLTAARSGSPLSFVTDEYATPTSSADLADAIAQLLATEAPGGIYHLPNAGEASRYDWARAILDAAGLPDTPVEPVTMAQLRERGYEGPEKPPYSVLANVSAAALGVELRDWRPALAAHFERMGARADA
jgi:dTDP-4-dehydrorhamnose reductase